MNDKVNFQELVRLLSKQVGVTKNDAENFLRNFFDLAIKGILDDQILKIKGLGTFKLINVEDRESINVQTGERVLIPAHKKISYTPDDNLSKTINEPFSMFFPVELGPGETKENAINLPPTENCLPETATPLAEIATPLPETADNSSNAEEEPEEFEIEETLPFNRKIANEEVKTEKKKSRIYILWIILAVFSALIAFVCIHTSTKHWVQITINKIIEPQIKKEPKTITDNQIIKPDSIIIQPDNNSTVNQNDTTQHKEIANAENQPSEEKDTQAKKYKLKPGERLTIISLREYGDKIFWVYLYEENKHMIDDPNLIPSGFEIVIPPASKYGINKDNFESIKKAKAIEDLMK